jgi:L-alanine-DL-glutamate epimerase-like enolase superfamily enzyme
MTTTESARRLSGAPPVERLAGSAYRIPTERPEADGTLAWSATTVVVAEVRAADGTTGTGWSYTGAGSLAVVEGELRSAVEGADPMDVPGTWESMVRRCRNLGTGGLAGCAISAVDVALWDLKARLLGVSLAGLLGRCRLSVPFYGSGGFTTLRGHALTAQVRHFIEDLGAPAVKLKIGESWGGCVGEDLERVGVARAAGDGAEMMVDANGGYSRKQAIRVGRQLADELGVVWFEEPVSSDDLEGLREVRDACDADVAAGEYGYDLVYFERMAAAGAVDCLQADATRCGGYTGFLRAANVAAAHGLEVSAHCAPNLHAPVAASVPNLRHVEYFYDHARLDPVLFNGIVEPCDGVLRPQEDLPGHGFELDHERAEQYRVT